MNHMKDMFKPGVLLATIYLTLNKSSSDVHAVHDLRHIMFLRSQSLSFDVEGHSGGQREILLSRQSRGSAEHKHWLVAVRYACSLSH